MIKVTISGPKGSGKTTVARALKGFLGDVLGYEVILKDEPGDLATALAKQQVFTLSERGPNFLMPSIEVYSNQEETEVLSNRELSQRMRRLEETILEKKR